MFLFHSPLHLVYLGCRFTFCFHYCPVSFHPFFTLAHPTNHDILLRLKNLAPPPNVSYSAPVPTFDTFSLSPATAAAEALPSSLSSHSRTTKLQPALSISAQHPHSLRHAQQTFLNNVSVKFFRQGEKDEDNTSLIPPYHSRSVSTPFVTPGNGKKRSGNSDVAALNVFDSIPRKYLHKPHTAQCSATERFWLCSFPSPYPTPSHSPSIPAQACSPTITIFKLAQTFFRTNECSNQNKAPSSLLSDAYFSFGWSWSSSRGSCFD